MSFRVEFGDSVVKPISTNQFNFGETIKGFSSRHTQFGDFDIVADDSLFIVNNDFVRQSLYNFSRFKSSFVSTDGWDHSYGVSDSSLNYYLVDFSIPFQFYYGLVNVGRILTSPVVINQVNENEKELIFGDVFGNLYFYTIAKVSLPFEEPTLKRVESFYIC